VLHAQADERGDVKEPAIVELLAGRAPEGQAVVLALEESVEAIGRGVDAIDLGVDGPGHGLALGRQGPKSRAQHLLVTMTLSHALPIGRPRGWEPAEGGGDGLELVARRV